MPVLRIASWNIHGLSSSQGKLNDIDFINEVCRKDVVALVETWHSDSQGISVEGFDFFDKCAAKLSNRGRRSGGIIILYKYWLRKGITELPSDLDSTIWVKFDQSFFGLENDLYICFTYRRPLKSAEHSSEYFDLLEHEIAIYSGKGNVMLSGDLNARIGNLKDYIPEDKVGNIPLPDYYVNDTALPRQNLDNTINPEGRLLTDICKKSRMRVLNGRYLGDSIGYFTYYHKNGSSTVDFTICREDFMEKIVYFAIAPPTYLSDHSMQHFMITCQPQNKKIPFDAKSALQNNYGFFKWDTESRAKYTKILGNPNFQLKIQTTLNSVLNCPKLLEETQIIMTDAAHCSTKFIDRNKTNEKKNKQKRQKWFDNDCAQLRKTL